MAINVIKNLCSPSKYGIKCPYAMNPTRIVVHNTANDASARNEIAYMISNDAECSFHYAIDDKEVVQGIPTTRNAWHAGDGCGAGNLQGIGIEICYSKSGGTRFANAEKLAAKFIAQELKSRGWGMSRVTKHQDYSGKYCPHRTLDLGWTRFKNMVQKELDILDHPETKESPEMKSLKASVKKRFGFSDGTITYFMKHPTPGKLLEKLSTKGKGKPYAKTGNLETLKKNVKRRYGFSNGTMRFLLNHKTPVVLLAKLSEKD